MGGACVDCDDTTPLLHSTSSSSTNETMIPEPHFQRNGTMWTALAHIITAVIGSGVLSLAWSMSQLGWIAGPLVFLLFAFVTLLSALCLSDCYKSSDPELGPTINGSYIDAVQMILGKKNAAICGVIVRFNFIKVGIVYTITSATSMRPILKSNCYRNHGVEATSYVAFLTGIAMVFPYFNQVVGVAGSINFWPITVYFPIEMYLVQKNIGSWTAKSVVLRVYSGVFLIVTIFAFIGSVKELISARFH